MFGINFLRSFFNSYTEKKTEEMMAKFGVFIRSGKSDDEIIEGCAKLLRDIKSDSRIVAAKRDDAFGGLKVFFNCDSGVPDLLRKKFLNECDTTSTIHPLTTTLTLHNAYPTEEDDFKESIRNQIHQSSGSVQVLGISKVPLSCNYPDIGTGKWKVVLDTPEVEQLDVFKTMGLPDKMVLKFPISNEDTFRVTFYCHLCDKDGHTQWRCVKDYSDTTHPNSPFISNPNRNNNTPSAKSKHPSIPANLIPKVEVDKNPTTLVPKASSTERTHPSETTSIPKDPNSPMPSTSKVPSGFRIRDIAQERELVLRPPMSPKGDIEAFIREIGKEEARRYCDEFPLVNVGIKAEKGEAVSPLKRPKVDSGAVSDWPSSVKRARVDPLNERFPNSYTEDVPGKGSSARASSTTTENDSVEIIYESNFSPRQECSQNPPENSPVVTTTNQHPEASPKTELPSTDEEAGDSNQALSAPAAPQQRRRKAPPRMLPVVIPDGVREIIASMPDGGKPLDVKKLEAFFNHVKKKSRPASFAELYTEDVEGLHAQLAEISRRFYHTPKTFSNADMKFMKTVGNVLQRFYNAPAKRRPDRPV